MGDPSEGWLNFRQLLDGFQRLGIPRQQPVLIHASLSAFGKVMGGAETVLRVLLGLYPTLVAPAFTFKTEVVPEAGPADNAFHYGSGWSQNQMAEFFNPEMPVDRLVGIIPETLRQWRHARRSMHPILSFVGVNADPILTAQTLEEPLEPIRVLYDLEGWVLLAGVDHTVNTSIHYGERRAGRKQFLRWALTQEGVVACPRYPGCSEGFQAIARHLEDVTRKVQVGKALLQAMPVRAVVDTTVKLIESDPVALLCNRLDCPRCEAVRKSVA